MRLMFHRVSLLEVMLFVATLCVALYFRVTNLGGMFSYDYDEGVYSMSARMILGGNLPFTQVFSSQPPHFILFLAAFLKMFGMSIAYARLFIVFTSIIGIIGAYLIARDIGGYKAGFASSLMLSISPYFLRQSRSVQSEIPSIGFCLIGIWLFLIGLRNKNNRYLLVSGLLVCLGAMMKLNIGLAALLMVPILLVKRNFRGLTYLILGLLLPLTILPFFDLNKMMEQMILFHLVKPATGTINDRWESIKSILLMDTGLLASAIVGVYFCAIKRKLDGIFIIMFTAALFLFLILYRAFFLHQAVVLIPPLAIMGGVALASSLEGIQKIIRCKRAILTRVKARAVLIRVFTLIIGVALLLNYCVSAVNVIRYALGLISQGDNPVFRDAVEIIRNYTDVSDYVILDEQILAFFAERDVPPDLVDTSHMRISSGYLDSNSVIRYAEQYRVKMVILWTGRLRRLSDFVNYVKSNYRLIKDYGEGREIYIRMENPK